MGRHAARDRPTRCTPSRTGICLTRENFIAYFYGTDIARRGARAGDDPGALQVRHPPRHERRPHRPRVLPGRARRASSPPIGRPSRRTGKPKGRCPGSRLEFPRPAHDPRHAAHELSPLHPPRGARLLLSDAAPRAPRRRRRRAATETKDNGKRAACRSTAFRSRSRRPRCSPIRAVPTLRVELLKIDPRVVARQGSPDVDPTAPTVVVFSGIARTKTGHPTLWLAKGAFSIATEATRGRARAVLRACRRPRSTQLPARQRGRRNRRRRWDAHLRARSSGRLPDAPQVLDRLLARLGCSSRMMLAHALTPALGGTTSLSGNPALPTDVRHRASGDAARRPAPTRSSRTPRSFAPEVWQPAANAPRALLQEARARAASSSAPLAASRQASRQLTRMRRRECIEPHGVLARGPIVPKKPSVRRVTRNAR